MTAALRATALLLAATVFAIADADGDWTRLMALDKGPGVLPKSADEALSLSLAHLEKQEKGLRGFIAANAADRRAFEARLRLVRLLALRAELKKEDIPAEVPKLLEEAEQSAVDSIQKADLGFARLTQQMWRWQARRPTREERREFLAAVKRFQSAFPDDRRVPSLLVEAAALFESEIATKEPLLREAEKLTKDPGLREQIADDLKRVALVGRPLPLRFTALDGTAHGVAQWRGKVAIVLFFAVASEPAKAAFIELQQVATEAGAGVVFVALSLDGDRAALGRKGMGWPAGQIHWLECRAGGVAARQAGAPAHAGRARRPGGVDPQTPARITGAPSKP
jgi:hypothetical protein